MSLTKDINYLNEANENNLWDLCLQLGMYGETYRGTDVKWAYTGGAGLNRVFDARFNEHDADERISAMMGIFAARGVDTAWVTGPSSTPANLKDRLVAKGYRHVPWAGMAVDLQDLPENVQIPADCEIVEVTDPSLIRPWVDVLCRGFGWIESIHEPIKELFEQFGVCNSIPWKHYLGTFNGQPASSCTVFEGSGVLGVYFVAVAPEARRRGLGLSTTWYALNEARKSGHRLTVLQASPMGKPVYEKINFETHCDMSLFLPF